MKKRCIPTELSHWKRKVENAIQNEDFKSIRILISSVNQFSRSVRIRALRAILLYNHVHTLREDFEDAVSDLIKDL